MKTGQHGTITNKGGVKIPVTVEGVHSSYFDATIDGAGLANTFYTSDWEFKADKPTLPTRRGSVVRVSDWGGNSKLWFRTVSLWLSEDAVNLTSTELEAFLENSGYTFEDVTPA